MMSCAALNAAVPSQPRHVAVAFQGEVERSGWWGPGRSESWADAIEAARVVATAARAELEIRPADHGALASGSVRRAACSEAR